MNVSRNVTGSGQSIPPYSGPTPLFRAAGLTVTWQDISLQRLPADAAVKDVATWRHWKPRGLTVPVQSTKNEGL